MPWRSKVEGGKEESKEDDEVRQVETELMNAVLAGNFVFSAASGDLAETVEKTCGVCCKKLKRRFGWGARGSPFNMRVKSGIARRCGMSQRREM